MARIEFIDQSLRDGQQSCWGMRMRAGHVLPVADAIDSAGYRVVDLTGSSLFEVLVRFRQEDPWRGPRRGPRRDAQRGPARGHPQQRRRRHGRHARLDRRALDPDARQARHRAASGSSTACTTSTRCSTRPGSRSEAGVAPSPQLNFSPLAGAHRRVLRRPDRPHRRRAASPTTIILGDEAGVLGPERARRVDPAHARAHARRRAARDALPQPHRRWRTSTTSSASRRASRSSTPPSSPLANGVSMPSTEVTVDNMRRLGHEVALDDSRLAEVAEHFARARRRRGLPARRAGRVRGGRHPAAVPGRHDGDAAQPARARTGWSDRLPAVLEEADPGARRDGLPDHGDAVLAARRHPGAAQRRAGRALRDDPRREPHVPRRLVRARRRARSTRRCSTGPPRTERGRRCSATGTRRSRRWRRSARDYGEHLSDEELLLRYLIPGPDVDAMYAAAQPDRAGLSARRPGTASGGSTT